MQKYIAQVDKHREKILNALDYIWKNPETGYKEWKTSEYLTAAFEALGYTLTQAGDIPGFYTDLDTGRPGPTVLVMGEMDSLICTNHPDADPETGAVHACGHCAQVAALVGIAAALKEPGVLEGLSGKIRLMAVPAEELIEVEYRQKLRDEGKIRYFGGKVEFMYRGYMDGVDLSFMIHTACSPAGVGRISGGSNGLLTKMVTFQGVAAHAGGAPHNGVNALYAANLALNAINALRETFKDASHIRVHPIITYGGTAVNAIPDVVRLESYVRGASMDDIVAANKKVNLALAASAAAMGAKVLIQDSPGYWPRISDKGMMLVFKEAMEKVMDKVEYVPESWSTGCSDIGDLSSVMPTIHPYVGGAVGNGHGANYFIADPETACVDSAKVQVAALRLLLENDAQRAKQIVTDYKPVFATKQAYFDFVEKLRIDCNAVTYNEDGTVTLSFRKE